MNGTTLNALVAADEALAAQLDPQHTEAEQLAMLEGARALIAGALAMRQEQPANHSTAKAVAHYQEMARLAELVKDGGQTIQEARSRDSHFFLAGWNGALQQVGADTHFQAAKQAAPACCAAELIALRDEFAGQAMQAILTRGDDSNRPAIAEWSYWMADAMLSARGAA